MYPTALQLISCSSVIVFLLGLLNVHFSNREDFCMMTYMYEYPQFVKIEVESPNIKPQYSLYAYSEGRITEKARKMWFDGVPVLFLPGNSGSHKQARSLASVALQKAADKGYDYHFDYFTISFNEELSGLYGGVLFDQTWYASHAIAKILSLYKNNKYTKYVPTSVILIGHSMGGVLAKRLLSYNGNTTNLAITLAAPLKAPSINTDLAMSQYYQDMENEWMAIRNSSLKDKKILISFGGGARDILVSSALTSSEDSFISALTTAIPGVWVSPDHVSMVWCKQLVLDINRYLFDIVDPSTEQITDNMELLKSKAQWYFQANRSTTLSPNIHRAVKPMLADAFWYEDNRRIYQIARPEIKKTTYLMLRLVNFPQNRFAAIEAVNVDDKDWVFGCNAKFAHNTYRYCKEATSVTELSRWTGTASTQTPRQTVQAGRHVIPVGRRKVATIDLYQIKSEHPDWTHVIVKVSPTRKPVTLNVDINDLSSRQIIVDLPNIFYLTKQVIKHETERNALYYELILPTLNMVHEAYLLYVEPSEHCKNNQYHVSAELHVPWAKNHEYYHYFTQLKHSPMKLILFKSNPNITSGMDITEYVKVTLLLDPKCTFTISISQSWYNRFGQFARHFTPTVFPYMVAVILIGATNNLLHLNEHGSCVSMVTALTSGGVKKLVTHLVIAIVFEGIWNSDHDNLEVQYLTRSFLMVPAILVALGLAHVLAVTVLFCMVFSSQIAHRVLFRIMWRGGPGLAEKVAGVLQKVPFVVTLGLLCAAQLSCGAAALIAGAAYYGFMLSKMYEEYLEDYFYKLLAKVTSNVWKLLSTKRKNNVKTKELKAIEDKTPVNYEIDEESTTLLENNDIKAIEHEKNDKTKPKELKETNTKDDKIISKTTIEKTEKRNDAIKSKTISNETTHTDTSLDKNLANDKGNKKNSNGKCNKDEKPPKDEGEDIDEDLSNLNFHMMMFLLWIIVTMLNVPALIIWARNFKYNMKLEYDTSHFPGVILSVLSYFIWKIDHPRVNLDPCNFTLSTVPLGVAAVYILVIGPFSLWQVNYFVTYYIGTIVFILCGKDGIALIWNKIEDWINLPEGSGENNENPSDNVHDKTSETENGNNENPGDNVHDKTSETENGNNENPGENVHDKTSETENGNNENPGENVQDKPSETENNEKRSENEHETENESRSNRRDKDFSVNNQASTSKDDGDKIQSKLSFATEDIEVESQLQDRSTGTETSRCVLA